MTYVCRNCGSNISEEVINLGHQPPSNAYLSKEDLNKPEKTYPLNLLICTKCWLAQLPEHASASELFQHDYAYFSSTSNTWCNHAKRYVDEVVKRIKLDKESFVVEIASNDGYLLQNFLNYKIPALGIEPTSKTAEVAIKKGVKTLVEFFSSELALKLISNGNKADLIIANNVLAHVPDIKDFILGISILLKKDGLVSFEFPHLLKLLQCNQFDTIYHEHYSYLSLKIVISMLKDANLFVFDVEELSTHGGSLRVWATNRKDEMVKNNVSRILKEEETFGLTKMSSYSNLRKNAVKIKCELMNFLTTQFNNDKIVCAYGAAAKGNTLLNYAGIKSDLIHYVADLAESKQNKFMPGSHIPIISPIELNKVNYSHLILLPWNLLPEIRKTYSETSLVTFIPKFNIINET